jgi:CBS domain-containing protein
MITVGDIIKKKGSDIYSVPSNEMAYAALGIMAEKNIGALLVIDMEKLVGIFSERDYARKVILRGKSSKETSVGELMSTPVFSMHPKKNIEECMALMTASHYRHVPVIKEGKLVGVISMGDIVNELIIAHKIAVEDLKKYIAGGEHASEWTAS